MDAFGKEYHLWMLAESVFYQVLDAIYDGRRVFKNNISFKTDTEKVLML